MDVMIMWDFEIGWLWNFFDYSSFFDGVMKIYCTQMWGEKYIPGA